MHRTLATAAALAALAHLAGCAASSSGVVPGFDGSLTISKSGLVAATPEALTHEATREAQAHCAGQGKRYRQIDLKESPAGLLGARAESELKFACD